LVFLTLLSMPKQSLAAPSRPPRVGSHSLLLTLSLDAAQVTAMEDARTQRAHRRARRVLTAGIAISASALIHAIWRAACATRASATQNAADCTLHR
jgi:hypothetical protein